MVQKRRIFFAFLWFLFLVFVIGPFPCIFFFSAAPGNEFNQGQHIGRLMVPFLMAVSGIITVIGASKGFLPGTEKPTDHQKQTRLARSLMVSGLMIGSCIVLLVFGAIFAKQKIERYINLPKYHS